MFFFNRKKRAVRASVSRGLTIHTVPDSVECVVAIGDVHGCLNEFNCLIEKIDSNPEIEFEQTHFIFLGDLIDRGEDSFGVLEAVINLQKRVAGLVVVKGNHEEVLEKVTMGDFRLMEAWMEHGGAATVRSYGLPNVGDYRLDPIAFHHRFIQSVPARHMDFLGSLVDGVVYKDYVFVHAGLRPGIPLLESNPNDLRWIRGEFLDFHQNAGPTVVHGHTVEKQAGRIGNRISLDTGAHEGGGLTALILNHCSETFSTSLN